MNWLTFGFALLEASLWRPFGLLLAAWVVLRVFRVRHPASRHAVWATVLIGTLVLPIVSVVTPHFTLHVWPRNADAAAPLESIASVPPEPVLLSAASVVEWQRSSSITSTTFAWPTMRTVIACSYVAGVLAMLAYWLLGWALLRRVVARSRVLRVPFLRESDDVATPVTVGVWRPTVLLPSAWRTWTPHTRRAVIAHEFAHLRRKDPLVAAFRRLATSVLWFQPVAWWVSRQTSDLAELACDAVALQRVGDPARYSRILVEFAMAVNRAGRRVALPGLAIASRSRMHERIDQVFEMSNGTMRTLARPGVVLAAVGLPALCFAAAVGLGASASSPLQSTGALAGQAASDQSQRFEVVSIKPCAGLPERGTGRGANPRFPIVSPGYAVWGCVTLSELANQAYVGDDQPLLNRVNPRNPGPDDPRVVRGGPEWVYEQRFVIEGKAAAGAMLSGPMVRAMLEDRFQLKLRRATEEQPMYALTVMKGGLKLTTTAPGDCWVRPPGATPATRPPVGFEDKHFCGSMTGSVNDGRMTGMTLQGLAKFLSTLMDRYVLDKTSVDSMFNIMLKFAADEHTHGVGPRSGAATGGAAAASASALGGNRPTIFKALEELGLRLDKTKGPSEYLVIDRVERPRPDNPALAEAPAAGATGAGRRQRLESEPFTTSSSSPVSSPPLPTNKHRRRA